MNIRKGWPTAPFLLIIAQTHDINWKITQKSGLRKIDVLRQAALGFGTNKISEKLHLSAGTVCNYLSAAIQKMDSHSRQEAVLRAKNNGWI